MYDSPGLSGVQSVTDHSVHHSYHERLRTSDLFPTRDFRLEAQESSPTHDSQLTTHDSFDLIVVGAGINGAGIARDAAMRGLRVLLLDKGDISSGTTAWSTRLIHGGLRYLEHFEIGLVRESLKERQVLLEIAPHLVKPIPMLIPIYRGAKRGRLEIRAGMIAYDLLSLNKSLHHHLMLPRGQVLAREPGLNAEELLAAAQYYDAQALYPERLALENAFAARDNGAVIRTYSRVDRFILDDRRVSGVEYTDLATGETDRARAPVTINVTGPWADQVLDQGGRAAARLIGGTKGSHIIVNRFPGAPSAGLYIEARSDRRPFFIIPWNGLYLIGTTDIRYSGSLDSLTTDESEIRYLIDEANHVIPGGTLCRASVLYTYSGVRPLPYAEGKQETAITRRHIIHDHSADPVRPLQGMISVIGGKLTTYRSLAEKVVDRVFHKLARRPPRRRTRRVRLPGATFALPRPADLLKIRPALDPASAEHLASVYGSRARIILDIAEHRPDLEQRIDPHTGAIAAEIVFSFNVEMARTLADALLRRTMLGMGPDLGRGSIDAALAVCKSDLGWTEERADRERRDYLEYIARFNPAALTPEEQAKA